jgi:hypothetical protein
VKSTPLFEIRLFYLKVFLPSNNTENQQFCFFIILQTDAVFFKLIQTDYQIFELYFFPDQNQYSLFNYLPGTFSVLIHINFCANLKNCKNLIINFQILNNLNQRCVHEV